MGRPSPSQKKAKRQRQKVQRKLVFTNNPAAQQKNDSSSVSVREQSEETLEMENVDNMRMGDVDTDVVEMVIYDDYRQIDGQPYLPAYLLKCREKLMSKVKQYRSRIHELEREVAHLVKSRSNEEKERLWKYYDTIAFAKSRTGRMVRSAMGTASTAGKIICQMETMYT